MTQGCDSPKRRSARDELVDVLLDRFTQHKDGRAVLGDAIGIIASLAVRLFGNGKRLRVFTNMLRVNPPPPNLSEIAQAVQQGIRTGEVGHG